MPSTDEHLRLARTFSSFVESANPLSLPGRQIELAIGAVYWSSLHWIDAVLAQPEWNAHPEHDAERFRQMQRLPALSAQFKRYRFIKDCYYDAMYRGKRFTDADLTEGLANDLAEISSGITRILGRVAR